LCKSRAQTITLWTIYNSIASKQISLENIILLSPYFEADLIAYKVILDKDLYNVRDNVDLDYQTSTMS